MRYGELSVQGRKKNIEINVPAGQSISLEDLETATSQYDRINCSSRNIGKNDQQMNENDQEMDEYGQEVVENEQRSDISISNSNEIPYADSSEGSDVSNSTNAETVENNDVPNEIPTETRPSVKDFVTVKYETSTKTCKYYVGRIDQILHREFSKKSQ